MPRTPTLPSSRLALLLLAGIPAAGMTGAGTLGAVPTGGPRVLTEEALAGDPAIRARSGDLVILELEPASAGPGRESGLASDTGGRGTDEIPFEVAVPQPAALCMPAGSTPGYRTELLDATGEVVATVAAQHACPRFELAAGSYRLRITSGAEGAGAGGSAAKGEQVLIQFPALAGAEAQGENQESSECLRWLVGKFAVRSLATDLTDPSRAYLSVQDGGEYTLRADRSRIEDRRTQLFRSGGNTDPESGFWWQQSLHTATYPNSPGVKYFQSFVAKTKHHDPFTSNQEFRAQGLNTYSFFRERRSSDCSFELWAYQSGEAKAKNEKDPWLRFTVEDTEHHPITTRQDRKANRRFQLLFRYFDDGRAAYRPLVRGEVALFTEAGYLGQTFVVNNGSGGLLDKFLDLDNNAEGLQPAPKTGVELCTGGGDGSTCAYFSFPVADFGASPDPKVRALANRVSVVKVFTDLPAFTVQAHACVGCDLDGSDLRGRDFSGMDFTGASFKGAILDGTTILSKAVLTGADLSGLDLSKVSLAGVTRLRGAKLVGTDLSNQKLPKADLGEAVLDGAQLTATVLAGAKLDGASLVGAQLEGTDLKGATLTSINLSHTDLTAALFEGTPDFGHDPENPSRFVEAKVKFETFGKDWSFRDLKGVEISGIPEDLSGLDARGTVFSPGWDFRGKKLREARFDGAVIEGARFSQADLSFASFVGARLRSANFTLACLAAADFTQAWLNRRDGEDPTDPNSLEAANFSQAILVDAVLDEVQADGVSFEDAVMVKWGGYRPDGGSAKNASFNAAKLGHAALYGMDLSGSSFNGASLFKADLVNVVAHNATFEKSPYQDGSLTSLQSADLRGADLEGASLDGANLLNARVSTSSGDFRRSWESCDGEPPVEVDGTFGPTVLGKITANTTCPDGSAGSDGSCAMK